VTDDSDGVVLRLVPRTKAERRANIDDSVQRALGTVMAAHADNKVRALAVVLIRDDGTAYIQWAVDDEVQHHFTLVGALQSVCAKLMDRLKVGS
jgi:hypothetical protein